MRPERHTYGCLTHLFFIFIFLSQGLVLVISREGKFSDYHNCQECTQAGWGWCPRVRRCGGFANKRCSGSETDTERSKEDQETWISEHYPNMKNNKSRLIYVY